MLGNGDKVCEIFGVRLQPRGKYESVTRAPALRLFLLSRSIYTYLYRADFSATHRTDALAVQ